MPPDVDNKIKSNKKFEIETVKPTDYTAIAAFLQGQKPDGPTREQWLEKFHVFWDRNPFFIENKHDRGWLLRDEGGGVFGFLGNIPVLYARRAQEETGFALNSWFVHPDARKYSLALFGCFMDQKGVLLNTTPTPEVEELLKGMFKFTALTADWIKTDYFFPVNDGAFFRFLQERFKINPIFKPISFAVASLACVFFHTKARTGLKGISSVNIKEVTEVPSDTLVWWDAFKKHHPFTLVRNPSGLDYFFLKGEYVKACKLLEIRCNGELLGFLACRLGHKPTYDFVEIVDLALIKDDVAIYNVLIGKLIELANHWKPGIAYIKSNAFGSCMQQALKLNGFFSVTGRSRFYFYDPQDQLRKDEFYGTPLDGDRVCF